MHINLDQSINKFSLMHDTKVKTIEAGNLLTDIEKIEAESMVMEHTTVCKSDCILLVMENELVHQLRKQAINKDREQIAALFVQAFPYMKKHYTEVRILEQSYNIVEEKVKRKDEAIIQEGQEAQQVFYLIVEGMVHIQQKIQILHLNKSSTINGFKPEKTSYCTETLMDIGRGEMLAEDWFLKDSPSSYKAVVVSKSCKILVVDSQLFMHSFGHIKQYIRKVMEARHKFMEERKAKIKFQKEFYILKFSNEASLVQQKGLTLFEQKTFDHSNPRPINRKIKKIYLRKEDIHAKSFNEKKDLDLEILKQTLYNERKIGGN